VGITPTGSLTACSSETKVITATFSDNASIQWLLNGAAITGATQASLTISKSGQYQAQVSNPNNCSALSSSLNLTISAPLSPLVSYSNGVLKSSGGNNMQWYLNGKAITGATDQNYTPTQSGTYAIKLTDINGCPASSENFIISILANDELNPYVQITAFPNPAQNEINLGIPDRLQQSGPLKVQIANTLGQLVQTTTYEMPSRQVTLDIRAIPNGIYVISFPEISNQTGIKFVKF
jgi:hypothetical protein